MTAGREAYVLLHRGLRVSLGAGEPVYRPDRHVVDAEAAVPLRHFRRMFAAVEYGPTRHLIAAARWRRVVGRHPRGSPHRTAALELWRSEIDFAHSASRGWAGRRVLP